MSIVIADGDVRRVMLLMSICRQNRTDALLPV